MQGAAAAEKAAGMASKEMPMDLGYALYSGDARSAGADQTIPWLSVHTKAGRPYDGVQTISGR